MLEELDLLALELGLGLSELQLGLGWFADFPNMIFCLARVPFGICSSPFRCR